MAAEFLKIRMWGLLFLYAYQMQNAYLVSLQRSKFLLFGALIASVSNVYLDYAMIFGHFGFPEMGFNGAAYASVISEILGMVTVFAVIYFSKISIKEGIKYHWEIQKDYIPCSQTGMAFDGTICHQYFCLVDIFYPCQSKL